MGNLCITHCTHVPCTFSRLRFASGSARSARQELDCSYRYWDRGIASVARQYARTVASEHPQIACDQRNLAALQRVSPQV